MNITSNSDQSTRVKAILLTVVMLASVVAFATPAQAAGTTDVVLEPDGVSLAPGDTTTVDVVVTNADGGVGAITADVISSNTNVVRVVDASVAGNPTFDDTTVTDSEASIRAAAMDTTDTGQVSVVTVTLEAVGGGTADLGLRVDALGDENADSYTVAEMNGATVEVNEGTLSTQVRLSPSTTEVTAGSTTTFDIVVDSANGGVGAIDANVTVSDLNVAEITNATVAGNPQGTDISVAADGSAVRIQGFGMDTADTGTVTVGTVVVSGGGATGTTDLGLTVDALSTEPGQSYAISDSPGATLEVTDGGGGTPGDETTVTVALDGAPNGLQTYSVNVSATNGASISSVEPVLITGNAFRIEDGGAGNPSVTAQGADIAGNVGAFQDQRTLIEVTFEGDVSEEDIELSVRELVDDDGNAIDPNRVTFSVSGQNPFTSPIGGAQAPPADPDDDGLYEDVNGDGQANFDDAVSLAFVQTGSLTQEQVAALDFDGDGDIDFDDAVELAFTV